jgi:ribosomal protein S2
LRFISKKCGGFLTNPILSKRILNKVVLVISFDNIQDNLLIKEINNCKIPFISLINTNINPDLINYPIIINNNHIKSVGFVIQLFKTYLISLKKRK